MKNIIRVGILLSGFYFISPVNAGGERMQGWGFAPATNFYGGGSLGVINQGGFDDGSAGTGKLFAGVRYRSVGAEVGYLKGGEAETKGDMPRDSNFRSDLEGFSAAAVGFMPITQRTELLGKVGAVYWDKDNTDEVALTSVKRESGDSGLSPLIGVGAQYKLYQNMQLRGEWEHIFATGEDNYESDADLLTVGVSMSTY